MRYLLGFVSALGLVASPLSVSAQVGEEGTNLQEPAPSAEPAPEEPALQLQLDDAGVQVASPSPRTPDGYTLEELELRKRRAAFGLIAPAAVTAAGVALLVVGTSGDWETDAQRRSYASGIALTTAGGVGMIVGLSLLGARARTHRLAERGYTPEEPALQLQLDDAGVGVAPSPPRTPDGYTLEEADLRVKRAKIGLGVSVPFIMLAPVAVFMAEPICYFPTPEQPCPEGSPGLAATFAVMSVGGLGGTIASGILLRRRKRDRRWLGQAHYGTPRRVQWDLARSQLMF